MNEAHLHLVVNHFPIIGTVISILVLVAGFALKSKVVIRTGLAITLFAGLSALPAMFTGDKAEHLVEQLIPEADRYIDTHEELAEIAIWVALVMAILALLSLVAERFSSTIGTILSIITLLTALGNGYLMKEVGTSGGEIRHTEIRTGAATIQPTVTNDGHDED